MLYELNKHLVLFYLNVDSLFCLLIKTDTEIDKENKVKRMF